jgi:inactive STAND/Trypsin-like peptidase domain
MPNPNHAFVRFLIDDKSPRQPVGAGFLVAPRLVLSCAHVVLDALNLSTTTQEKPEKTLFLDFPFVDNQPLVTAKVLEWYPAMANPHAGNIEDLVLMELSEEVSFTVPLLLVSLPDFFNRSVSLTGFPRGRDEGVYLDGNLKRLTGEGRVQIDTEQGRGDVAGGFSGSAVYDIQKNAVVGVVVSIDSFGGNIRAYMIPAETIVKAFPQLSTISPIIRDSENLIVKNADLLPYLANRVDQELALHGKVEAYQSVQTPFICVIHGKPEECSDGFIKRIRFYTLNKIIPKQVQQGTKRYIFSCDSFKNEEELHKKMWASLGEVVVGCFAKPDEIAQVIAQQNCLVLLCVTMNSDDCLHNKGIQSIEFFLNFWRKWPAATEQCHLLLVCFSFNYIGDNSIFGMFSGTNKINKRISNYLNQQLDFAKFNLSGVVLPELTPIEQKHVEDWARMHLDPVYEKLQPKIRELFKSNKAISMETLALHLEEMLETVKQSA